MSERRLIFTFRNETHSKKRCKKYVKNFEISLQQCSQRTVPRTGRGRKFPISLRFRKRTVEMRDGMSKKKEEIFNII